ncbi:MAG: hypothetical protein Q4C22_04850, partial [Bacillota bacterium]|nr:hypothetical protein [Bacillota bacterium]
MDLIKHNLLEGETIIWEGRCAPFSMMEKPYDKSIKLTWLICALIMVGIAVVYVPVTLANGIPVGKMLLYYAVIISIPVFICIRPFCDCSVLRKKSVYAVTNYRVLSTGQGSLLSLFIEEDTELRVDYAENGTGTIFIGEACEYRNTHARRLALAGVRDEEEGIHRPLTGLAFYLVEEPAYVCECIRGIRGQSDRKSKA